MSYLYNKLRDYSKSGAYAFHMPGHKRNRMFDFCNPFEIDITEIDGFDDLNHPEGILKECMDYASVSYGTVKTFFLVNGSTSGLLTAVSAVADYGDTVIVSRNCHKSIHNAIELRGLNPRYIYHEYIDEYSAAGGIRPEDVEEMLDKNPDTKAVVIVSPTYDGVCSDVKRIADIVHRKECILIVDEAHGAHFKYNGYFPESAVSGGADIVVQSVHKTLPSFTQTGLLHVNSGRVNLDRIQKYLSIYQSSSPSYVLMAGIDNCIRWMNSDGIKVMEDYCINLKNLRERIGQLTNIKLLSEEIVDKYSVKAYDCAKIVVSLSGYDAGHELYDMLRIKYNIQPEMCTDASVTLMTSVADTAESLECLGDALTEINSFAESEEKLNKFFSSYLGHKTCVKRACRKGMIFSSGMVPEEGRMKYLPSEAVEMETEETEIENSGGRIAAVYLYIYPPGIPIVVPGERICIKDISIITDYINAGLKVHGLRHGRIPVIKDR